MTPPDTDPLTHFHWIDGIIYERPLNACEFCAEDDEP